MLRLVSFFAMVFIAHAILSVLPVVGPLLRGLGIFSFWAVAILVSYLLSKGGDGLLNRARLQRRINELEHVDTPSNQGKLGLLLLKSGRLRQAIEPLEAAFKGQPEIAEWSFGLGRAYLGLSKWQKAGQFFARTVVEDAEHGFGEAHLGLAEAAMGLGRAADALEALDEHDRRQSEVPRGLFLRGQALRKLGRGKEARVAFGKVLDMHSELAAYQRKGHFGLAVRAFWLSRF